nr:uncharacterized protein LOC117281044 [Nicotiana tomentosiformis]
MLPYPGNVHIDPLEIQIRERHGYCNAIKVEPDVQPWYHDIKRFLKTKEYPEHASGDKKRTIRRLANSFFLSGEVLYKRTPDLNLLRCVDAKEAEKIINEVHSGVCGPHTNGYILAKKILRAGYYWMTMENDCFSFVRKCHQCQIHGDLIHAPPSELHPMSAPWPFVAWAEIEDDEWVKTRLEHLTMIDEKRMVAVCHGQLYQQRMACVYNKKVRPRNFEVGQLILRRILLHHEEAKGKFAPNWKGLYIIRKLLPKGALYLGDIEGNDPETAVNVDAVKRYYV